MSTADSQPTTDPDAATHASRVIAVIRALRLDAVIENLAAVTSNQILVEQVRGYGRQKDHLGTYDTAADEGFLPKVRIEFTLAEELVPAAVEAVCEGARTGRIGDGKVFVHRVPESRPLNAPSTP